MQAPVSKLSIAIMAGTRILCLCGLRPSVLSQVPFQNFPSFHLPRSGPPIDLVSARSLVPLVLPFATLAVPAFVEVVPLALPPWCFQAPVSLFGQEGT